MLPRLYPLPDIPNCPFCNKYMSCNTLIKTFRNYSELQHKLTKSKRQVILIAWTGVVKHKQQQQQLQCDSRLKG